MVACDNKRAGRTGKDTSSATGLWAELAQCLDCCNLRFLVAVPRFKGGDFRIWEHNDSDGVAISMFRVNLEFITEALRSGSDAVFPSRNCEVLVTGYPDNLSSSPRIPEWMNGLLFLHTCLFPLGIRRSPSLSLYPAAIRQSLPEDFKKEQQMDRAFAPPPIARPNMNFCSPVGFLCSADLADIRSSRTEARARGFFCC